MSARASGAFRRLASTGKTRSAGVTRSDFSDSRSAAGGRVKKTSAAQPRAARDRASRRCAVRRQVSAAVRRSGETFLPVMCSRKYETAHFVRCLVHPFCPVLAHCLAGIGGGAAGLAGVLATAVDWHFHSRSICVDSRRAAFAGAFARMPSGKVSRYRTTNTSVQPTASAVSDRIMRDESWIGWSD